LYKGVLRSDIILYDEKQVIYYAKKYIKDGWQVYSIDYKPKVHITYEQLVNN